MTAFLNLILQNSLSGTVLVLIVLLFRKITGSLSKFYVRLLWLITLLVLALPPVSLGSLHTARSLLPETELVFSGEEEGLAQEPAAEEPTEGKPSAEVSFDSILPEEAARDLIRKEQGIRAQQESGETGVSKMIFFVWAVGAAALAVISLTEWLRLKRRVSGAVRIRRDVWCTKELSTPFVMPGLPSRIYIPRELEREKEQLGDILKHERMHIRNYDPWIKCFAVLVLVLHWFNPLVWLAFRLMNRDMEMYCDECVLRGRSMEEKKHYAQTLLDFACKSRGFSPAVYFGESSTKIRILHVLYAKRPHALVSLLLLLFISGCGLSFWAAGEKEPEGAVVDIPEKEVLPHISHEDAGGSGADSAGLEREEEDWTQMAVVGMGHAGLEPGYDETEMSLMGKTEQFALYGMEQGSEMVVRTPECLVWAAVPVISNYEIEPLLLEQDFDGDGERELAVITYVLHGTGISIRSLFMTDHASDGSWKIYQYLEEDYMSELTPHYETRYTEEGVRLIFDGAPVGIAEEVEQEELDNGYSYYAGSLIDFRFVEDRIYFCSELMGYSDINFAGRYPGHELDAQVEYLGEGAWRLTDISYADAEITDIIEEAVPAYLTGRTEEVNAYCTAPGVNLSDFEEPCRETAILSIRCPLEELSGRETEAYVTIRIDKEDSLSYLHIPMKRIPLESGGEGWRIAGEISMEK